MSSVIWCNAFRCTAGLTHASAVDQLVVGQGIPVLFLRSRGGRVGGEEVLSGVTVGKRFFQFTTAVVVNDL